MSDDDHSWDGIDRRRPIANLAESGHDQVQVPIAVLVVGFAAVIILQVASIIGHGLISNDLNGDTARSDKFRRQISCYVVGTAQGKAGTDLLTACGFLSIGGE